MDRRSFLKGAVVAAAISAPVVEEAAAAILKSNGLRLSVNPDDIGYREWCELESDGYRAHVFLNGKEIRWVSMADERLGAVTKCVETPNGRKCMDKIRGVFLEETLHGEVRIEIRHGGRVVVRDTQGEVVAL